MVAPPQSLTLDPGAWTETPISMSSQLSSSPQATLSSDAPPTATTPQQLGPQSAAPHAPTHLAPMDHAATTTTSPLTHSPTLNGGQTTSACPQPSETPTSTGGPTALQSTSTSPLTLCAAVLLSHQLPKLLPTLCLALTMELLDPQVPHISSDLSFQSELWQQQLLFSEL